MLTQEDKQRISEQLSEERMVQWFTAQVTASEERMMQRIEVIETKLLTEFHKWAQTDEVRARGVSRMVAELDERVGFMAERISELERKLRRPS